MQSLRSHPFFASINWKTLWSDPAPPIESGLVKRQHPLGVGHDQNWEDVGAAWDDLVGDEGQDADGMNWASDGEGTEYNLIGKNGHGNGSMHSDEVGPLGEIPRYAQRVDIRKKLLQETAKEGVQDASGTLAGAPIDVPTQPRDTFSTGSTSSSECSPTEKLGTALESLTLDRGRTRALTPVQGNGHSNGVNW